ncbi:uncharacterized protein A4U43_C07F4480 [Asparagus officinalis]|uniref:BIRD-IDD transcription factor second C2H2 zinc finger domain-containing protein n=1 Tax=Asparagus officinalis TaxID=4686 RepID=A0A5P1ECP5_ASPOF|nr:uncharacterized protein A4U43_C07F4480 [Asparagus officinalis]
MCTAADQTQKYRTLTAQPDGDQPIHLRSLQQGASKRDQNLQLHRRPQPPVEAPQRALVRRRVRRVFVCLEPTCVHHDPARALGDLTGIKKAFQQEARERDGSGERGGKKYAVRSDWKC